MQLFRLSVEPCDFHLQYRAKVTLEPERYTFGEILELGYAQLPDAVLPYLNPSRYCESDRLTHFAMRLFGNYKPGFSQVSAICDWINQNLDYQPG